MTLHPYAQERADTKCRNQTHVLVPANVKGDYQIESVEYHHDLKAVHTRHNSEVLSDAL